MKRKISLSTTVTLVLLTMALTITLTMLLAMRHFNNQLQLVSKRQAMYSYINDVDKIVREYYPDMDEALLRQSIAQGYIYGIDDPYAEYFTTEHYEAEKLRMAGKANNLGIVLGEIKDEANGTAELVVIRVHEDSPASRAVINVGDKLVAIDGTPVIGRSLAEVQAQINTSTKLSLTVRRGEGESSYPVTADEYDVHSVQSAVLDNVGYVRITAFYENTPEQFKDAVASLMDKSVTGIVFDVRNNTGGSPKAVQDILSQVMPLGAYGTMTDTKGKETKLSTKVSQAISVPTVTLINGSTAGEAEFFAGVLQEAGLTTVLGQTSEGKAKYQQYFVLEQSYSALKLTVGEYGLMKGGSWEGKGIEPSQKVELPPEQEENFQMLTPNEDVQVQAAVDMLSESSDQPLPPPNPPVTDPSDTDPTGTDTTGTASTTGTTTTTATKK